MTEKKIYQILLFLQSNDRKKKNNIHNESHLRNRQEIWDT